MKHPPVDIEIIDEEFSSRNNFLSPGDILVSLRNINSLAVIDRSEKKVKWSFSGPFLRQHDPDCLPDGTILIFDNRMDEGMWNEARYFIEPQSFGYSRVIQVVPKTQQILWSFQGSRAVPFYTSIQGNQQFLENGNLLIVESEGGRVFELDNENKNIIWEFRNILKQGANRNLLGRVTYAQRVKKEEVDFF